MVRKRPNSIQTLPLYYWHLSITYSSHGPKETKFHTNSTSIILTPLYYGQFTWSERDQIPYKLYLYNTDTSLLRTVHLVQKRPNSIQTLPLIIRTPLYYGQFTWPERDQIPYKLYLYNTDTSLLRTVHWRRPFSMGPVRNVFKSKIGPATGLPMPDHRLPKLMICQPISFLIFIEWYGNSLWF